MLVIAIGIALLMRGAVGQPQFAGDSLQLWWCDATDPLQRFMLQADGTLKSSGGLCVENTGGNALSLQQCTGADGQKWTYNASMFQNAASCWNMQSGEDFMFPNSSVRLYDCNPPAWNDYFTMSHPAAGLILANATSSNNSTYTDLCVQTLHVTPPLPTADQVNWLKGEVACFVHYNMATMVQPPGFQGCSGGAPPSIDNWAPTALDTDSWVDTCASMGAVRVVYVAKHGCGFAAWQSNVTGYNYTVANSHYPEIDVVASFVASAKRKGLGYGFYYSVVSNAYLNVQNGLVQPGPIVPGLQMNVTQEQYDMIVVAQLTELWGAFGPLAEVWFDGGYQATLTPALMALFAELQPHVVAFQAEGLMPSPVRWVGSESGEAPYPCWSTCDYTETGAGDPNSPTFFPAETDFTLQNGDQWFYNPTAGVRGPLELRYMYETSVGSNTALIIDVAPFANGSVPEPQVQAAQLLGQYTGGCYRNASAVVAQAGPVDGTVITISVPGSNPTGNSVSRIVFGEDQMFGQLVRGYNLTAVLADGSHVVLAIGSSVGSKRIQMLIGSIAVSSVTLTITASVSTPHLTGMTLLTCDALAARLDAEWDAWVRHSGYESPPHGWEPEHKYERLWA